MTPDELRQWRAARGISQRALARALGMSLDTIRSWEIGRRPIPTHLPLTLAGLELRLQQQQQEQPKGPER